MTQNPNVKGLRARLMQGVRGDSPAMRPDGAPDAGALAPIVQAAGSYALPMLFGMLMRGGM